MIRVKKHKKNLEDKGCVFRAKTRELDVGDLSMKWYRYDHGTNLDTGELEIYFPSKKKAEEFYAWARKKGANVKIQKEHYEMSK